jgi:hypothetical protein
MDERALCGRQTLRPRLPQTPRPAFLTAVPPAQRTPRNEMLKIALTYYDALVNGDGSTRPAGRVAHEERMSCQRQTK